MKTFSIRHSAFAILLVLCASSAFAKDFLISDPRYAVYAPRPDYPLVARQQKITGSGVVRMKINSAGQTKSVGMAQSTGSPILDRAAIEAFRRWRFKPGAFKDWARCPITFTMSGAQY
ncbi:MAG: hypothetical protein DLM73_10465 [Chthoniobacterales bacterium]|nr:MAG: hypothetical protein DLM73_10465 [Chthoniobacterales bacterium]